MATKPSGLTYLRRLVGSVGLPQSRLPVEKVVDTAPHVFLDYSACHLSSASMYAGSGLVRHSESRLFGYCSLGLRYRQQSERWRAEMGDPRYIVDLVKRVTTISAETMRIMKALPPLEEGT